MRVGTEMGGLLLASLRTTPKAPILKKTTHPQGVRWVEFWLVVPGHLRGAKFFKVQGLGQVKARLRSFCEIDWMGGLVKTCGVTNP